MRLLTILGVVQTACLLFLVFVLIGDRQDAPAALTGAPVKSAALLDPVTGDAPPSDDARLRRIIREELAAQAHLVAGPPEATARPRNPVEDQLRRERVSRQLDYYKRLGRISPSQMQALQNEIAQLDPVGQKAMLANLVRSLNLGEIDGRL